MITQSDKQEILQWVAGLNDQSVLLELRSIKQRSIEKDIDIWNDLSPQEQNSIEQGLDDLANGRVTPHSEVKKLYEKWL